MLARHYANIQMSPAHHAAIPLFVGKVAFIPSTNSSFFVLDEVEIKHSTFSFKVTYTLFHRDKITLGTCSRVGDRCTQVLITVLGGQIPLLILFTGGALAPDDHQSNQCTLSTSCCISEILPQPHPAQDNTPNYHLLWGDMGRWVAASLEGEEMDKKRVLFVHQQLLLHHHNGKDQEKVYASSSWGLCASPAGTF